MQEIASSKRKLIAEGYSGKIYLTKINIGDDKKEKVAIKKFNLKNRSHYFVEKQIFQEVNPHPLFPQIYFTNDEQLEIFMEYCRGGTLFNLLSKCGKFDEELSFRYFKQILKALRHLKKKSICHRDIKLENILILRDDNRYLKITDMSFCARIKGGETKSDFRCFKDPVGTEGYQSPEMLKGQAYSGYEADIFALGVVLFEMIHGKPPFLAASQEQCEFYSLFCNNRKQYWDLFGSLAQNKSPELVELIEQMLESDPDKRISLGKIFKTTWFTNMHQKLKKEKQSQMKDTQIDFDHYRKLSSTYMKSNFLTFLSRVFQNNTLNDSLTKIKIKQKHNNTQNKNNEINSQTELSSSSIFDKQETQTKLNNGIEQNLYSLLHTNNGIINFDLIQDFAQKNCLKPIVPQTRAEPSKTMSLSPNKQRNPKPNLIGNILNKKVLCYEERNDSSDDQEDYNRERLQTEPNGGSKPYSNIFQLIRQNSTVRDIHMKMSYIQLFSKPVDMNAIKQKYSFRTKSQTTFNLNKNNNNITLNI